MDHRRALRGDCDRCKALCCIALGFDRSSEFPFDKPANVRCAHLTKDNRCAHHGRFTGCARYDCYGAGQHVSAMRFDSNAEMYEAFRLRKDRNELLFLLHEAKALALDPEKERERLLLIEALERDEEADVRSFFRSLSKRRLPIIRASRARA